jgi:hypothetical protein
MFTIQIFSHGRIVDYAEANHLLSKVQNTHGGWNEVWSQWETPINDLLKRVKDYSRATEMQR